MSGDALVQVSNGCDLRGACSGWAEFDFGFRLALTWLKWGVAMRFINIWFNFRPGGREQFLSIFRPLVPWIRSLDGVLYFELGLCDGNDRLLLVNECFVDDAAHAAMWAAPQFKAVRETIDGLVIGRRVDVHHADAVSTEQRGEIATFGPVPPQIHKVTL